jgi:hypothetical protein
VPEIIEKVIVLKFHRNRRTTVDNSRATGMVSRSGHMSVDFERLK